VESGAGLLYQLVREESGVVEAADLVLVGDDFVMGYVSGAAERLQRRVEVNTALVSLWNRVALENSVKEVNMGRGLEPYKMKWCSTVRENHRLTLGSFGIQWLGVAGYLTLRDRLSRSVRVRRSVQHIGRMRGSVRSRLRGGGLATARGRASGLWLDRKG
jgi:hypothetical protein